MILWTMYVAYELHLYSVEVMRDIDVRTAKGGYTELMPLRLDHIFLRKLLAWLIFFSCLKFMKFMNLNEQLCAFARIRSRTQPALSAQNGTHR